MTANKMYRPVCNQHMIFGLLTILVIVAVRFTNLLFSDVPYVLTDVIVLAQRRKTDDLSAQLKLRYKYINKKNPGGGAALTFPFCAARFTPAACITMVYSPSLSGSLFLGRVETFQVFLIFLNFFLR